MHLALALGRYDSNPVEYFVLYFYRKEHANYDESKSNRHFEKEKDLEGGQRRSVEKEIGVQGGTWGMVLHMLADRQKWRNRSPWRRPYVLTTGKGLTK